MGKKEKTFGQIFEQIVPGPIGVLSQISDDQGT